MSDEGVRLVIRLLLAVSVIVVVATLLTLVGPGRRRGRIMLAGTLSGISFGVLAAYPVSQWLGTDASAICACLGVVLGWAVAWSFARQIPREAN